MAKQPLTVVIYGGTITQRTALAKHMCHGLERDPMIIGSPDTPPFAPPANFYTLAGKPDLADAVCEIATNYDAERLERALDRVEVAIASRSPETCATAQAALEKRFPLGAQVQLTSGGPSMTVSDVYAGGCCGGVGVVWMDNDRVLQREEFEVPMLTLSPSSDLGDEIPF